MRNVVCGTKLWSLGVQEVEEEWVLSVGWLLVDLDFAVTTTRCCRDSGVILLVRGFPNPVGKDGGVRRYKQKSRPYL
jgi:hypothetical protein